MSPMLAATEGALVDLLHGAAGRASVALEDARASVGDEPWLWSDIGVARAANRDGRPLALAMLDGLEAIERALELDPAMPEALFNRAHLLAQVHLVTQAADAWRRYLEIDSSSPWSEEARRSLARLEDDEASRWRDERERLLDEGTGEETRRMLVARFLQRVRLEVEDNLLPEWGRAWLDDEREAADEHLRVAELLGRAVADVGGDPMLARTVAAIRKAREARDGALLERLARGHDGYGEGMRLYGRGEDLVATKRFAAALSSLAAAGSPFAGWARFRRSLCDYYSGENAGVVEEVGDILRAWPADRHPALAGRAYLLLGMAKYRLAQLGDAIQSYQKALDSFERIGEGEHVAASHFMLGEGWRFHGERRLSWEHRLRALELASPLGDAVYYYTTLYDGAQALHESGDLGSALLFQNEMLSWGEETHDDLVIVETLGRRAQTHLELGDPVSARADAARAWRSIGRLPEGERRLRMELALRRVEAESMLGDEQATELLSEIIEWAGTRQDNFRLPELYALHARSLIAQGRGVEAEADLSAAIEAIELQAKRALDDPVAGAFFDQRAALFEEMVQLQLELGDRESAFHYFERGRTRKLREVFLVRSVRQGTMSDGAKDRVVSPEDVAAALPASRALVAFALLREGAVAWIVSGARWEVRALAISRPQLEEAVDALGRQETSMSEFRAASALLFEVLWRPLLDELERFDEVVIVPDGVLHAVPFAALWDAAAQKWVAERWTLITAPSATVYLHALERDAARSDHRSRSVLAVGAPALVGSAYDSFSALRAAADEARHVGSFYHSPVVLTGAAATRGNVLDLAPSSGVIHFATHALLNERNPLLSALLLSSGGGGDGPLYAHDIYRLSLPETSLVVLSACQTVAGRLSKTEGVDSLARAFLAAGVTAVLGTLWEIDDVEAQSFGGQFHRRVADGMDPMHALQAAQLAALANSREDLRPPLWAAYQLIGGVATRDAPH